ncbi:MAG: hypothetical protein ABUK01_10700 [Leptospirales bacterium]
MINKITIFTLVSLATASIFAYTIGSPSIAVEIRNSKANRGVSLHVVDETSKTLLYESEYNSEKAVEATDKSGNYRRVISGLNDRHTYSVSVKIDTDGAFGENETDLGKTIARVTPGETLVIYNLFPLLELKPELTYAQPALQGRTAFCFMGTSPYVVTDLANQNKLGYVAMATLQYDSNGMQSITTSIMLPNDETSSLYKNVLCAIDYDDSESFNSGDLYQIIEGNFLSGNSTPEKFPIGEWLALP